jgi:hypothetical protein
MNECTHSYQRIPNDLEKCSDCGKVRVIVDEATRARREAATIAFKERYNATINKTETRIRIGQHVRMNDPETAGAPRGVVTRIEDWRGAIVVDINGEEYDFQPDELTPINAALKR